MAHDWFYNEGPDIGRLRADLVLYSIGRFRGAGLLRAQAVKSGVNFFGWMSYKKGRDKITFSSCYNRVRARLRVAQLTLRGKKNEKSNVDVCTDGGLHSGLQ